MVKRTTSNVNLFSPIKFSWNDNEFEAKLFNANEFLPENVKSFAENVNEFSLDPAYLAIKHQEDQPVFLFVIFKNQAIVGISSVYQAKVDLKVPGHELTTNKLAQWAYDFVVHPLFKNRKILCLGSLFISGDKGNVCQENIPLHDWHKILITGFSDWNLATQKYHKSIGWLGLDLCNDKSCLANDNNHIPIEFEPIMELDLSTYENFEDYKESLKAKFRTKLNKAVTVGEKIVSKRFTPDEVAQHQTRITDLFTQVKSRSVYYGGDYDLSDLIAINKHFSNSFTTGFFLNDELIGFSTTIINNNTYIAHMIGMDYRVSKSISLYENILYQYIKDAIDSTCKVLNMGRTALVIKSGVGANPHFFYCCLQFNRCWWHKIGKFVAPKLAIQIPSFRKALKKHEVKKHTV